MKQTSCGVIIFNDHNEFLGCIPFGKKDKLDLPKGIQEEDENHYQTAVREVFEETGLKLDINKFIYIGCYKYLKDKNIKIFIYKYNFDLNKLKCLSFFDLYNKKVPEMIGYKKINLYDFNNIEEYFYKNLNKIIIKIIKENF